MSESSRSLRLSSLLVSKVPICRLPSNEQTGRSKGKGGLGGGRVCEEQWLVLC